MTGVQTCALPIFCVNTPIRHLSDECFQVHVHELHLQLTDSSQDLAAVPNVCSISFCLPNKTLMYNTSLLSSTMPPIRAKSLSQTGPSHPPQFNSVGNLSLHQPNTHSSNGSVHGHKIGPATRLPSVKLACVRLTTLLPLTRSTGSGP